MTYVTKNGVTVLIDIPEGEKKETHYAHTAYVKACGGNERMAAVMDYFIYTASKEIKDQQLPKGCNVVTFTRTHEQILQTLSPKPSRKSLIRYIATFNQWGMVHSQPYQREFHVDLGRAQEVINCPPPASKASRRRSGLYEKGGQVTTLQPFAENEQTLKGGQETEVSTLRQKVDKLQLKVDTLQLKVCNLSTFLGQVTTLQRSFEALVSFVQDRFPDAPLYTFNILPLITNKEESTSAVAERQPLSPALSRISLLDGFVFQDNDDATPSSFFQCSLCHQTYSNHAFFAIPDDVAPCGHQKSVGFEVRDSPLQQATGDDNGHGTRDRDSAHPHGVVRNHSHYLDSHAPARSDSRGQAVESSGTHVEPESQQSNGTIHSSATTVHDVPLPDEITLPSAKSEADPSRQESLGNRFPNVPDPVSGVFPSGSTSSSENGSQPPERATALTDIETRNSTKSAVMAQDDATVRIVQEGQQQALVAEQDSETGKVSPSPEQQKPKVEKPAGPPQMPPVEMKWGPEKMVQITEAKRYVRNKQGAYFSEEMQEKSGKSQRQRQLESAKKILALEGITEERYIRAYDERNDQWWNSEQGSLTVEHMYAKTTHKVIRILEILEKLESKSAGVGTDVKRGTFNKQREEVQRKVLVEAATNTGAPEPLDPEKQAKVQQFREMKAQLKRQQAENLKKMGAM